MPQRQTTCTRENLHFWLFLENTKHPIYTTVMLLDVDALAAYQQDPNLDNSLLAKGLRACPIKFVGHTPNGRHIDSTGDMLDSTYCLFESFISKVALSCKGLHEFDVVQAHLKIERKTINGGNIIQTRGKTQQKKHKQLSEIEVESPLTPKISRHTKKLSTPTLVKTPPYAKRMENKIDLLLESKESKKNAQQQSKLQNQVAKMSTTNKELLADNSRLQSELQDFQVLKQLNEKLAQENEVLRKKSQVLSEANAAQEVKIEDLTREVWVFRDIIYRGNKV